MSYDTIKADSMRRERWARKRISSARDDAGDAEKTGAGRHGGAAPRSLEGGGDMLARIEASRDVPWLKAVLGSAEFTLSVRRAAQRRLGGLVRKPRL